MTSNLQWAFGAIQIYCVANSLSYSLKGLLQTVFALFKSLVLPSFTPLYIQRYRILPVDT